MRPLAIILAALLLTVGSTAQALTAPKPSPPGQAEKRDPLPASKQDEKPSAADTAKEDKPTQPGKADEKPTPPGKAKEAGEPADPDKAEPRPQGQSSTTGGNGTPKPDQDEAQDAVEEEEALPLGEIVRIARSLNEGRVVNARLLRINGVLLYQLTMLDEGGHSWRDYYLARSGNPVEMP